MDMKASEVYDKFVDDDRTKFSINSAMEFYANQKLIDFINWYNETNNIGQYISNSRIGQFNLSQNEKDKGDI